MQPGSLLPKSQRMRVTTDDSGESRHSRLTSLCESPPVHHSIVRLLYAVGLSKIERYSIFGSSATVRLRGSTIRVFQ